MTEELSHATAVIQHPIFMTRALQYYKYLKVFQKP